MQQRWFKIGGFFGGLAVVLGAFGAHALKSQLENSGFVETYKTAVFYHCIHSLFLIAISMSPFHSLRSLNQIGTLASAGILLFSGSLYFMSTTGWTWVGPITPVGGLCLIAAWLLAALRTMKSA